MKVKIHHEGENILLVLFLIIVASGAFAYRFFDYKPVAWCLIALMAILFLLVLNFFRLPRRHFKGDNSDGTAVLSSVDGTVVALEEVYEDEYLHRNVIQLYANWVPVKGEVTYVKHHSGRFLAANLPKSSSDNERSSIVIRSATGEDILVRQIAGAVARRIVTYVEQGETVDVNDFIGFIKFGSRVDIFLPLDTEIKVKLGDRTWGGETMVARLKNR